MKRKWIPVATMGALVLGYLAGSGRGGGSPVAYELHPPAPPAPVPPPAAPAPVPAPPVAPAPMPPPLPPVDPPAYVPPPEPVPRPTPSDGLGEYPAWYGVDLNCKDVGYAVRVTGPDPHDLDRDGDGIGCDSYGPPR